MEREVFHIIPAGAGPIWLFGVVALVVAAMAGMLGFMVYSSRHATFEVTQKGLRIRGDIYGRMIPIESIVLDKARKTDLLVEHHLQPIVRTNGAGLPGYSAGWFRLRDGEKALIFVTDRTRVAYVPTKNGYSVMMSVEDPGGLAAAIRKAATQQ